MFGKSLWICMTMFLFLFVFAASLASQSTTETIDNADVIELTRQGFGESVLLAKIAVSRVFMNASQEALLELKSSGVPDSVIVAMMQRARANGYISDGPMNRVELPGGTKIKVITNEKISGRKVKPKQVLELSVSEDVQVSGVTIVRRGTPVRAVVSDARSPGSVGRSGRLSIYIESTTAIDGQIVKLRSAASGAGGDNFGTALTLSVFWGVGLLIPGKNAEIKSGTVIEAVTEGSIFVGQQ